MVANDMQHASSGSFQQSLPGHSDLCGAGQPRCLAACPHLMTCVWHPLALRLRLLRYVSCDLRPRFSRSLLCTTQPQNPDPLSGTYGCMNRYEPFLHVIGHRYVCVYIYICICIYGYIYTHTHIMCLGGYNYTHQHHNTNPGSYPQCCAIPVYTKGAG